MHAGFAQFAAFDQDAADNKAFFAAGKLRVPVLALGGEKSFGTTMAAVMRFAASDVEEGVVPELRTLDHGRKPQSYHRAGSCFPRQGLIMPADCGLAAWCAATKARSQTYRPIAFWPLYPR